MKYLVKFNESKKDTLWELISDSDWDNRQFRFGNDMTLSSNESTKIRDSINKLKRNVDDYSINISVSSSTIDIDIYSKDGYGDTRLQLYTKKMPDNWFFVKEYYYSIEHSKTWRQISYIDVDGNSTYESYYKCDDIEGLAKLVNDRRRWLESESR